MSMSSKIFTLVLILSATFFYSHYSRKQFDGMKGNQELVLKSLPDVKIKTFTYGSDELTDLHVPSVIGGKKALFVHYWGTWCAPCEVEFPEFLKFAEQFESDNISFLIIAVNDEIKKVNKFLKRFKKLPSNVILGFDNESRSMEYFGTVKVPETYLFDSVGSHLTKFVGPQDWANPTFYKRSMQLLNKVNSGPIKQYSTN